MTGMESETAYLGNVRGGVKGFVVKSVLNVLKPDCKQGNSRTAVPSKLQPKNTPPPTSLPPLPASLHLLRSYSLVL